MLSRDLCERRRGAGCHSCPAGILLLSPAWAQLFLIPARPLFPQHWPLRFTGENVVFVLLRLFIPVLPWWGQAGEGLPGRIQSLAAGGQGPPLSPFLCLAWVAPSALHPLLCYKPRCVGGGEGMLGKQLQLLYFLKIAFVHIFSLILI